MAVIKSSSTVVPADSTPNHRLSLSEFDQPKPWTLTPLIFVYKPNHLVSTADLTRTLSSSLSRALVPFYPLAGRLRWIGGGRLEIDCNAMGAELVVAESDSEMAEFGDFDPTPKIKPLLPKLDYTSPIENLPIVSAILTKFACGGVTIGIAISHAVLDGTSYTNFVNSWAKLARGEDLAEADLPSYDRFKLPPGQRPEFDHVEYKPLPVLLGRTDCEEEAAKDTSVAMLKLTEDQLNGLKRRAKRENKARYTRESGYSTYDIVTAHVWRCACKARRCDPRQPTVARVIVDCRRRLKPTIERSYFGNAILTTITDPKCVFGDIISKPLSYAAERIREAIVSFGDEYIKSALSFIASQEDVSWIRTSFHIEGSRTGQFLGNPNISVTSWINVVSSEADFGWGKPAYIGPSAIVSDGKCYIIPKGDGSVVVALRLQTEHINLFKMFFYQDITDDVSSKL